MKDPAFTIGIEEEYLLVDRETRDLAVNPPPELFEAAKIALGERVTPEFLRSQIEVGTTICGTLDEARRQLRHFRATVGNWRRSTAWRRSPPRPIRSRTGRGRCTPTRSATTCWRATCRRSGGAC